MASAFARSILRSGAARCSTAGPKLSSMRKPMQNFSFSPIRCSKQNLLSHRLFRSPVEMSCCVESMLPYHTATASALLTSMLSVSRHSFGWNPEDG